jgi:hypothetical protein
MLGCSRRGRTKNTKRALGRMLKKLNKPSRRNQEIYWSHICHTARHLIELYQEKHGKNKPSTEHESHFTHETLNSKEDTGAMNIDR